MTKKIYFLLFSIVFFSVLTTYGAYLKNVPQKLIQPDGTIIHCFATGDEFYNWLHDSSGYTIVQDPQTGYFVYAVESQGELLPTKYIAGKANPMILGLKKEVNISVEKRIEFRKRFEELTPQRPVQKSGTRNHGHINNIVFFIRFANEDDFGNYYDYYDELLQMHNDLSSGNATNSMSSYYNQISYGKFSVSTTAYPVSTNSVIYSYQDEHPRNHYKRSSADNPGGYIGESDRRNREHDLLRRVVTFLKDSVPASLNLDFDNDGNVDNVCFIVTGGENEWNTLLWPHRWSLHTDPPVSIHEKRVYDFNLIPIRNATLGTITHEFMHTLGAPDLYRYDTYSGTPVGQWDLMASTNDYVPQGMGAYIKHKYGNWIESIEEITSPGTYTLYPANGTSPDKTAYIIRPNPYSSQYILLEYRKTNSNIFEEGLPSSGIIIYRINEEFEGNARYDGETVFDEVYIFRPSNSSFQLSNAAFYADSGKRTEFTLFTNPYTHYHDGSYMPSIEITNITELGDSIQFTVGEVIDSLAVSNEIVLDCASGSSNTLTVNSNTTWTILGTCNWLSVETTEGRGNQNVMLKSLSRNDSEYDRICTLNIQTKSYYHQTTQRVFVRHKSCNSNITEQTDLNKQVILTPNPVSDILTVHFQQIGDFTGNDIAAYSVQGQKIQMPVSNFQEDQLQLNVSTLASGIYYLKIQTSKGSVVKTFSVR